MADLDVSAASGLVIHGDEALVVADDEHMLCRYALDGTPRGRVALFSDPLPDEHHARKAAKADLEALARLPDGRLLALGSGATPRRRRGAIVDGSSVWSIDLEPLHVWLAGELPELNLEGAAVVGDRLALLQRGNGAAGVNALVLLDLDAIRAALAGGRPWEPALVRAIHRVSLGDLDGAPLGFTDACPRGAELLFAAAAEAGGSVYEDGIVAGSVVGAVSVGGDVRWRRPLGAPEKVEGISLDAAGTVWLVNDPDDRSRRATLATVALGQEG